MTFFNIKKESLIINFYRGENLKVDKRANFCIFLVIALIALGLSNFAAAFTGDLVSASFPGINDTDKMIALDDDNFTPLSLNAVYEKKVVEEVNETENETDTNSTIEEDVDEGSDNENDQETDENTNTNNNNNNNNQNTESDTGNNDNSGGDSSVPTPSQGQTEDAGADE